MNKSLKAWITFVKKVQKEEKLSYKDAIHRAKIRKNKGEKWMTGGIGNNSLSSSSFPNVNTDMQMQMESRKTRRNNSRASLRSRGRTRSRGRSRMALRSRF